MLAFKISKAGAQSATRVSIFDGRHDSCDLTLDGFELRPIGLDLLFAFGRSAVNFFLKGANELAYEFRRHQPLFETRKNPRLDFLPRDRGMVVAGAFAAACGAAISVLGHDREPTGTAATFE